MFAQRQGIPCPDMASRNGFRYLVSDAGGKLNEIAQARGQTLAQMALAWALRHKAMTSVLVGASRVSQIEDNVAALGNLQFMDEELASIDGVLAA